MNEKTKKMLNFDPVASAETLLGKKSENWNDTTDSVTAINIAILSNQTKAAHLKSLGDTHFGIKWNDFIQIAKAYGFKVGLCYKFEGNGWSDNNIKEEEILFFHEEKGLILHAESYNGSSINSASVYGEVKVGNTLTSEEFEALNGCSFGHNGNGTLNFNVDVREGFLFHLNALSEVFEFSKSWSTVPFLWFLNYMDTKKENYNYKEITKNKIYASTPEIQKIIYG